jgi:hypothetical protein
VIRIAFAIGAIAVFGAAQTRAQESLSSPPGALFGTGTGSASSTRLDMTAALSQAYESVPPQELGSLVPQSGPQSGGVSSALTGTTEYARKRRRFDLNGRGSASLRYYQRLDEVSLISSNAAVGGTLRLSRRTTLELTQDGAYSPSYLYRLFPSVAPLEVGESVPAAPDYRVDATRSYSFDTRVKLTAGSARQSRLELRAERNLTNFTGDKRRADLDVIGGAARWSHGIGRTGSLFTEYEYREGGFGFGGRATEQRLRIGGDWTPALSRTRRATVRYSVAPSVIEIPESVTDAVVTGTLFKFEGEAGVEYPFFRTWSAGGSYSRGVEYIAVLLEPVFRDAARLEVVGLPAARLDVSASAGLSVGASAFTDGRQRYDAYTGTARARYAVGRSLAIYGEYLYYYYQFHDLAGLAVDLPSRFQQHGVRAGFMLWARPVGR